MDIFGIYMIIFGLILLIAPNMKFLPIFKKGKNIGIQYHSTKFSKPIWYRLGGIIVIIIGLLELFEIVNVAG